MTPSSLFFEVHGPPSGNPLVLVHGFGTHGFTWHCWLPTLAQEHRVYVLDLKGFGRSPKPRDGRYGPMDQADLLKAFLLEHRWSDVTLGGHSLGAGIALLTALLLRHDREIRVRRLVLVAPAALPQPLSPWIRRASRPFLGPLLLWLVPPRLVARKALELAYADPGKVTHRQVEAYARPLRSRGGRYAVHASARALREPGAEQALHTLSTLAIPTLLLWGEQDRVVPPTMGERLAALLPQAILVKLSECGHMPQEECPEASLAIVEAFLRGRLDGR